MKNVFNMDLDQRSDGANNSNRLDGDHFITRRVSKKLHEEIQNTSKERADLSQKTQLPSFYKALESAAFIAMAGVVLYALQPGKGFVANFAETPFLLPGGILALALFIFLRKYEATYLKKLKDNQSQHDADKKNAELTEQALKEFGVPEDAVSIDVLGRPYHLRRGKEIRDNVLKNAELDYINYPYRAYIRRGKLHLANAEAVFAIPVNSFTEITPQKRRLALAGWNKEADPQSKEYKSFHVSGNQGKITAKCYSVGIKDSTGDYEILVPNYDIDKISQIIRLPISA